MAGRVGLEDADRRACSQLAKACLAARERAVGLACFAHVTQDRGEEGLPVEFDVRDRRLGIEQAAIGTAAMDVAPLGHAPCRLARVRELAHVAFMHRLHRVGQQHGQRLPEHLVDAVAEHTLGSLVEQHDDLARVDHHDGIVGDRQQALEQCAEVFRL